MTSQQRGTVTFAMRRLWIAAAHWGVRPLQWVAVILLSLFSLGLPSAHVRAEQPAQSAPLTREFFVGLWETRNVEHGRDVRILWQLHENGSLNYVFEVDGVPFEGSKGTWEFRDGIMQENWDRPDGSKGQGRGSVEKIDENTISLRILDNGSPEYTGLVRTYRRLGPAQLVLDPVRRSVNRIASL